ncbi:nuclear transport factor 2 family protein [uncultured Thiothrix sp.]|uniref:nuclear transport factor 2 family protein n=1 Tax=uncultured Thiothrix sp. TaxID=223185 RepID=UPI002618A863|nr:nuclear transport factor 2 family protein [uncultured Thiothrix sp.]HMT92829.1 nuclear transport factor 2 family protein [Thiolinea sp.]
MYHRIVRHKLLTAFAGLNTGHIQAVLKELSDSAEHYFIGDHALGEVRHTRADIQQWYERLLTIFPDIQFTLHKIEVKGMPWNTLVSVYWTEVNHGTDGVRTENTGVNLMQIRWGKVTSIRIYTDTVLLTRALARLAKAGNLEASKPAIES